MGPEEHALASDLWALSDCRIPSAAQVPTDPAHVRGPSWTPLNSPSSESVRLSGGERRQGSGVVTRSAERLPAARTGALCPIIIPTSQQK